jgi:hypothetical protein
MTSGRSSQVPAWGATEEGGNFEMVKTCREANFRVWLEFGFGCGKFEVISAQWKHPEANQLHKS